MKRLLCIVGSMDMGGAETFLMKIYRSLDKTKYQMDFCVAKKEKNAYEEEILDLGGKIYRITPKSKNFLKNFNDIKKIVKQNKYKYVMRISQHSLSSLELFAAKLGGAKKLIYRSSNSNSGGSKINLLIHYAFRPVANLISNVKIAPSKDAAIFMFGKRKANLNKVIYLNNGLDIDVYKFSTTSRNKVRNAFNVSNDTFVIGHVGRFNFQKNHKFLIDIFDEYRKLNSNCQLWLVGKGELEEDIKKYVDSKKLNKYVIFLGARSDVNEIYSAMDCFVFPSLFEGMPNTLIEAQANGLECYCSDTITKDSNITDLVSFLDISGGVDIWIDRIIKNKIHNHIDTKDCFINKKYEIRDITSYFEKIVFGGESNE